MRRDSVTQTLCSPGICTTPSLHKSFYISETIQVPTPKPLFFMVRRIQWKKGILVSLITLVGIINYQVQLKDSIST